MNGPMLMAIAALFTTSCLVRILPAFISPQINSHIRRYLERLLPTAVFINLAVYILHGEVVREPIPGLISLAVVCVFAGFNLLGLIGTALFGITLYFFLISILV